MICWIAPNAPAHGDPRLPVNGYPSTARTSAQTHSTPHAPTIILEVAARDSDVT
ncbi:MAG TPA: hypothetical protein VK720_07390 [Terracidiphilus sp.]|jgi:hypothetical protein|nr:hypothetical protein [Terracidiphilus sp.]